MNQPTAIVIPSGGQNGIILPPPPKIVAPPKPPIPKEFTRYADRVPIIGDPNPKR